jgi:sugar phosphate isomerase/epimerase
MPILNRRQFLGAGAVTAAAACPLLSGRAWASSTQRPVGIQLYTVSASLQRDVSGTLRQIRNIGYTEAETAGLAGLTAVEFRHRLDEADLKCHSAHLQVGLTDREQAFADASTLGAHYVVSSALFPPHSSGLPDADGYRQMADRVNEMAQQARHAGLQYAYHNHNFEFRKVDGDKTGYDVLLEHTDPAVVDLELDCGWMIAAGYDPVQYLKRYPRRYRMLHIKDFVAGSKISVSLTPDLRPKGTELGRGHIDYRPILNTAAHIGIAYYYVEQEPPFPDMTDLDAARVDFDYLHPLLAG